MGTTLKTIATVLWTKHRKKLIAMLMGLLLAGAASVTDIPVEELKDAARDAAGPAPLTSPVTIAPAVK